MSFLIWKMRLSLAWTKKKIPQEAIFIVEPVWEQSPFHFKWPMGLWMQSSGLLLNSFLILLSCGETHLHIAVVHNTAYNIFIMCFTVLKIIMMPLQVFHSRPIMFFTLPYLLFTFCYCFSSITYVKRIIHKANEEQIFMT